MIGRNKDYDENFFRLTIYLSAEKKKTAVANSSSDSKSSYRMCALKCVKKHGNFITILQLLFAIEVSINLMIYLDSLSSISS